MSPRRVEIHAPGSGADEPGALCSAPGSDEAPELASAPGEVTCPACLALLNPNTGTAIVEHETPVEEGPAVPPDLVKPGDWLWVLGSPATEKREAVPDRLGCVVYVGSNYVKLESPQGWSWDRIHLDRLHLVTRPEPNPTQVLQGKVEAAKAAIGETMEKVRAVTARLGCANQPGSEEHGTALARVSGEADVIAYRTSLEKAVQDELPALKEELKERCQVLTTWLGAEALPLKSLAGRAEKAVKIVKDRIHTVSLYAGLTETVTTCREGKPAPAHERLRVMQRKLYMDEECLLDYRHGGMEFKNLPEFDAWLAKPKNLERVLPFPRCLVALQVRRETKDREAPRDVGSLWVRLQIKKADQFTYLYVRNGERLYRIDCQHRFGELIFAPREEFDHEPMVALHDRWARRDRETIEWRTVREHEEGRERARRELHAAKKWRKQNPKAAWIEAWIHEDTTGKRAKQREIQPDYGSWEYERRDPLDQAKADLESFDKWEPVDSSSVHFDECRADLERRVKEWNRVALIIQGLYDRSDVLSPHAPVQTWTPAGFEAAVELIQDGSWVLHDGPAPDLEAYVARCNAGMGPGSVTLGQERFWLDLVQEREQKRRDSSWRYNQDRRDEVPRGWRPRGNEGPGFLAVPEWNRARTEATFHWKRHKLSGLRSWEDPEGTPGKPDRVTVPREKLFNVSGYRPGDFVQFFRDPRTRERYLEWAPLLLSAEEYHAGTLGLGPKDHKKVPGVSIEVPAVPPEEDE